MTKKHGTRLMWHENGQLWYQNEYLNGKKHGLQQQWYMNGHIAYKERYVNDSMLGLQEYWHAGHKGKYFKTTYTH